MTASFAVSNLAWPAGEDAAALAILERAGGNGIEIAPSRAFPGWPEEPAATAELQSRLAEVGFEVVALQGILFGAQDVNLFDSEGSRERLAKRLGAVARLAGRLGAHACVFGAPRLRDPGELEPERALAIAVEFFQQMAPVFEGEGTCLTIEANARCYGCRFLVHTAEAVRLVRAVARPGVRVQIDTGTMLIEGEDFSVIADAVPLAGHFHASEPGMKCLGSSGADHGQIARRLDAAGYAGSRTVEMLASENWAADLERAAAVFLLAYGGAGGGR